MSDQPAPFQARGLFAGLSADDLEAIQRVGSTVSFPADAAVFTSGDEPLGAISGAQEWPAFERAAASLKLSLRRSSHP